MFSQFYFHHQDPQFYLTLTSRYFFRHAHLHHLRIEQYNRYFSEQTEAALNALATAENTMDDDREVAVAPVPDHRHYDTFCETTPAGQCYPSDFDGTEGVRRRLNTRLAVSRNAWIEPLGNQRVAFYEMRLLLTLAWFCPEKPVQHEDGVEWHFRWAKPSPTELRGGVALPDIDLYLGRHHISFEKLCQETDDDLSHWRYGLVCRCCAGHFKDGKQCEACTYAVGFHRCGHSERDTDTLLWRRNSLWFRRSPLWGFWALNRLLYSTLFHVNRKRRQGGIRTASSLSDPDPFTRFFGTASPASIPESTEWWKCQQKELFAITDDAECGIMQAMVTISHNDNCAELLATVRRGVGARPTEEEYIEYLLSRKKRSQERPPTEYYALEHVLSYQRRSPRRRMFSCDVELLHRLEL